MNRFVLGTEAPPPRCLAFAWVAATAWTMSMTAFTALLAHHPPNAWGLVCCSVVPTALSLAAARFGTRGTGVRSTFGLTVAWSVEMALFCPPLTLLALRGLGIDKQGTESAAAHLVGFTVMAAAFISAPLGLAFGTVYGTGLGALKFLRGRASHSQLDLVLLFLGVALISVSAVCALFLRQELTQPHFKFLGVIAVVRRDSSWVPLLSGSLGLSGALLGSVRLLARMGFRAMVHRGSIPGWHAIALAEVDDAKSLPRLFPFGRAETVLVHSSDAGAGPFRRAEMSTPVARM